MPKLSVMSWLGAMILAWEDAKAVVFKIQPFAGLISYHRLCHANTEYLLLTMISVQSFWCLRLCVCVCVGDQIFAVSQKNYNGSGYRGGHIFGE